MYECSQHTKIIWRNVVSPPVRVIVFSHPLQDMGVVVLESWNCYRNNNICPLPSHYMWSQDIVFELLDVLHFIRPHILNRTVPRTPLDISDREMCGKELKKNLSVRSWSSDLLSFDNTNLKGPHMMTVIVCQNPFIDTNPSSLFSRFFLFRSSSIFGMTISMGEVPSELVTTQSETDYIYVVIHEPISLTLCRFVWIVSSRPLLASSSTSSLHQVSCLSPE